MKALFSIFLIFGFQVALSQEIHTYIDSLNGFSIGIPKNWNFQISKTTQPGIKLFVLEPESETKGEFRANYNVNLVSVPNTDIDKAYLDLKSSISLRGGYQFLKEGDTTINGIKYRWLLENHDNSVNQQLMTSLILLGYKGGIGYMVTFATVNTRFYFYEPIFRRLAWTFRL